MSDENEKNKYCLNCNLAELECKCQEMCCKCKFYVNRTCSNEKSGNFKILLPVDAFCSKFQNKNRFVYHSSKGWF